MLSDVLKYISGVGRIHGGVTDQCIRGAILHLFMDTENETQNAVSSFSLLPTPKHYPTLLLLAALLDVPLI